MKHFPAPAQTDSNREQAHQTVWGSNPRALSMLGEIFPAAITYLLWPMNDVRNVFSDEVPHLEEQGLSATTFGSWRFKRRHYGYTHQPVSGND